MSAEMIYNAEENGVNTDAIYKKESGFGLVSVTNHKTNIQVTALYYGIPSDEIIRIAVATHKREIQYMTPEARIVELQRRIDAMLRGIELARAIFTNPDDATDYNADVYAVLDAIKDAK